MIGAGQMGAGIAQVCAAQGLEVVLGDVSAAHAERALARMRSSLERLVAKGTRSGAFASAPSCRPTWTS